MAIKQSYYFTEVGVECGGEKWNSSSSKNTTETKNRLLKEIYNYIIIIIFSL